MTIFKTRQEAERYAKRDHEYYVRYLRGNFVVWCEASDHEVEFDGIEQEKPE
jgi:hypothetical protein